jgi:hypothetical protein
MDFSGCPTFVEKIADVQLSHTPLVDYDALLRAEYQIALREYEKAKGGAVAVKSSA